MRCQLHRVGLQYKRRFGRTTTLKERTFLWLRGARTVETIWALQDVSFSVGPGETVGLIGANGSGKSSLLKLLAGIYPPDHGSIDLAGRVVGLLELGAGFQKDLTGRENVFLYGAILGMEERQIQDRLEAIHEFSGLGPVIDTPVRQYSSGMVTRLGFSVAAYLDPDLLLIDEILAVGDFNFQQKCIDHMTSYRESGRSLIFVSHDLDSVNKLCQRTIWIDLGRVVRDGPTESVLEDYREEMKRRRGGLHGPSQDRLGRWGTGEIEITGLRVVSSVDSEEEAVPGEPVGIVIEYEAHETIEEPVIGLGIHHRDGMVLTGPNTLMLGLRLGTVNGRGAVRFGLDEMTLLPGEYRLSASIYDTELTHAYDHLDRMHRLTVQPQSGLDPYGCVHLPWQVESMER